MKIDYLLNDLGHLDREWEHKSDRLDLAENEAWAKGVWFGVRIAVQLLKKHITAPLSMRGRSGTPYASSADLVGTGWGEKREKSHAGGIHKTIG